MAAINDYYYEDLTPESLAQIIDDFRAGKTPAARLGHRPQGLRAGRRRADPDRPDALRRLAGQEDQDPEPAEPKAAGVTLDVASAEAARMLR